MALTVAQIRPAVKAAIEAATLFANPVGISALPFDGEIDQDEAIENALKAKGTVIALTPCLGSVQESAVDARLAERAFFAANVRTNGEINGQGGRPNIDHDAACDAVISALLTLAKSNPAFVKLRMGNGAASGAGGQVRELLKGDAGLLTHAVYFSVPVTLGGAE